MAVWAIQPIAEDWINSKVFTTETEGLIVQSKPIHDYADLIASQMFISGGDGSMKIVPLNGIFGYPEMDSLVICGAPDTLAFLVYFTGEQPVENATLRLKLGGGIQFGGFVTSPNPGTVQLLDNDPTKPRFLLPYVAQDSVAIIYVGLKASCSSANYFNPSVESEIRYTYQGNNCVDTYDFDMAIIQQAILVPVLNIRNPLPAPINFTSVNQTRCQTLTISQDGIRASLDSFTFMVDSLDLTVMDLVSITVNGQAFPLAQANYDPVAKRLTGTITGNYFMFNSNHQGPANMLFNTDEQMTIQFCYSVPDCFYTILSNLKYTIEHQCGEFKCNGVGDQADAPVVFNPNFGATPRVAADLLQAPEVCGDPARIEVKFWSQQANPATGLFEDMRLTFNACDSAGMIVSQITVGSEGSEVALPMSIISYQGSRGLQVNLRDLDFDPDGAGGLFDSDGDGFFDDLAGGDTIRFVLEYAVNCPEILQGCFQVACRVENVRVEGLRHCKRAFSQTATPPTTPIIGFSSNTAFSADTAQMPNLATGYNFGKVGVVGGVPTAVTRTVGVDMNYMSENFVTCGGTHIAEIEIAGEAANNASFANAAFGPPGMEVPIAGPYTVIDSPAVTYLRVEIPGPVDPSTDYRFLVDVTFDTAYCRPAFYMGISAKLKEDCDPTCSCQVVKACGSLLMYIDPDDVGCACVTQTIVDIERVSTGYTDKTLSSRIDMDDVDPNDKLRFLPGDTMLVRGKAWVLDTSVWNQVNSRLEFMVRDYPITINMTDRKRVRSVWDTRLSRLQNAYFKRGNTVIDLSTIMCIDDGDGDDVSANSQSGLLLDGPVEADEPVFHPGMPTQTSYQVGNNSSDDRLDGWSMGIRFRDQTVFSPASNNPSDCLKPLLDMIGGHFEPNDTFEFVWHVPVVSNPGFDPSAGSELQASPLFNGVELIKRDFPNSPEVNLASTCWTNAPYSFHEPQIFANSEITYNACGAEVVHTFEVANPPPVDWYQNEYRPVIGLEQFYSVIPPPLAYAGGATMIRPDGVSQPIEPTGSRNNMSSFEYAGVTYYKPNQSDSQLWFNDAENEDGTATRYASAFGQDPALSYDQGDNDLTRIGGTFPLMGVGLSNNDSLVFKIPLVRVCPGDVDESGLTLQYDASYRLLTNYNDPNGPFLCNWQSNIPGHPGNFYWGNCGPDNMTVGPRYWDFNSADTAHVMRYIREEGINYFRTGTLDALPSINIGLASIQIGNLPGGPETNRLTLCAGSGTNDLADVVFTVTVTSTVMMVGVNDDNGDPVPFTLVAATVDSNVYLVNAADIMSPNSCLEFDILTELLLCPSALPDPSIVPEPRICINAAAGGCLPPGVVGILTGGTGGCTGASDCYFYTTDASDIQVEWVVSPQNIQLCDEVIYHARNKNVRSGTLFQPSFTFDVNDGVTPVAGSWEYAYPGGPNNMGPWMPAPDATMTSPGIWHYPDVGAFIPSINSIGLPSIDATMDSNFIAIRFRAVTVCDDFLSGVSPKVETEAFDGCGNFVGAFDFAPAIIADGANPLDYPRFIVVAEPDQLNCGVDGNQVTITGLALQGSGMTENTTMCLTLPIGMTYAGNLDFVIPSSFTPANFNVTGGGANPTLVCFDLPDGITVGNLFVFNFDMDVDETMPCGEAAIETDIRTMIQSVECVDPPSQCEAFVSNTLNREVFFNVDPPVDVVEQVLYNTCDNDPLNTTFTYEVALGYINTSLNTMATFSLYRDLDLNGVLDDYDPLLDSETQVVNIPSGDTVIYSGSFMVPNALACPVFLVVDFDTPCACDRSIRYFDNIEPFFFADLPDAIYLCAGDDLEFETCSDFSLSLTPSDGATITDLGGGMVRISINPGFGIDQPVTLLANSNAGTCDFAASRALYQLPSLDIGPYEPVRVCDNAISQLSLNLPPEWEEGAEILWMPALYLDDPTSPNPEIIEPQTSLTYTVTVSFNDGQCSVSAPFPVVVETPGTLTLTSSSDNDCIPIQESVILTATPGYDFYRLFQIVGGFPVFVADGTSNTFMVPNNVVATYRVEAIDDNKPCEDVSNPVVVMAMICRDFGDLPNSYATLEGSNGPNHAIIDGLYLGMSVDSEPDGQPSPDATGDGNDEDGVAFYKSIQWIPGGTVRLPLSVVNTTGETSYLQVWVDWNGNGSFESIELVSGLDDSSGAYPSYISINIPNTAVKDKNLGFRIRLSLQDGLSSQGPSDSGEIEDYIIRITCPVLCTPATSTR